VTYETTLNDGAPKRTSAAVFAIFLFSILLSFLVAPVALSFSQSSEQDNVVGVKAGDWMLYWFYVTDPVMENKVRVRVQVVNVSGTNITYWIVFHKNDQPEYNLTVTGDIFEFLAEYRYEYGRINNAPIFLPTNFTAADFNADFVNNTLTYSYTSGVFWNYNESARSYGGVERQVNVINTTWTHGFYEYSMISSGECCWDKATGVLLAHRYVEYVHPRGDTENKSLTLQADEYMKIVDTNLWYVSHPSNTQLPKIVALGTILFGLAVLPVAFRTQGKGKKREAEE